jgi:hypothetical protein
MDTSTFQAKARLAASAVSSMNPTEALAKSLTSERPTINSAIKSYMSLCAARSMSASDPNIITTASTLSSSSSSLHEAINNPTLNESRKCFLTKSKAKGNPQQAALLCARSLLKSINSFTVPPPKNNSKSSNGNDNDNENEGKTNEEDQDKKLEFEVVRILWNGLVKNGKKPSMCLGRTSLSYVFPLIQESCFQRNELINGKSDNDNDQDQKPSANFFPSDADVDLDEAQAFIDEFGDLLINAEKRKNTKLSGKTGEDIAAINDDDSCLLWDLDGGKSELERRRKRRDSKSAAMKEKESNAKRTSNAQQEGLTIEEIE